MEPQTDASPPKRRGCLKIACVGCACLVAGFIALGLIAWYYFTDWQPGRSAWEHIPASAEWAIEAHDINSLLQAAANDYGMQSLLLRLAREVDDYPLIPGNGGNETLSETLRETDFDGFISLQKLFLPNIMLIGGRGTAETDLFIFVQPPAWIRLMLTGEEGKIGTFEDEEHGTVFYNVEFDGWLVLSLSEEILKEIVSKPADYAPPFGKATGRNDAFLQFAWRESTGERDDDNGGAAVDRRDNPSPNLVMMNNPFAAPGQSTPDAAEGAGGGGRSARIVVTPASRAWDARGRYSWNGDEGPMPASADGAVSPPPLLGNVNIAAEARVAPDVYAEWIAGLPEFGTGDASAPGMPWLDLANQWLREAWLANASGDFLFRAEPPSREEIDGVPPMPLLSLGWEFSDQVDADAVRSDFSRTVVNMLEAASAPGGQLFPQALRAHLKPVVTSDGTAVSGHVDIPPVAANAMRPAWLMPFRAREGWLLSDPNAAPVIGDSGSFAALRSPVPAASTVTFDATWNMSSDFRNSLLDVAKDRLSTLGPIFLPDFPESGMMHIEQFITAYPVGSVDGTWDTKDNAVHFRLAIPHGRETILP